YLPSDFSVEATGPTGATVFYFVSATDDQDPSPQVTCAPLSGSPLPLGDTTISCTATDSSGNVATGTFKVHVLPALNLGLSIASAGTVKLKTGVATITGSVRCGHSASVSIYGQMQELVANRAVLSGSFSTTISCSPPTSSWSVTVTAVNGRFGAGQTQVNATAINC